MMAGATHRVEASPGDQGTRVDVFLARALPALSRSRIQQLARQGLVTRRGHAVKTSAIVEPGDVFELTVPAPVSALPAAEDLPLHILYEDADIVVVNKPVNMVVHPGAGHASGTLVNALLHRVADLSGIGGAERPGIVHRLDRGTSGVMVVAKHDQAHRDLSRQFHDRQVVKEYVALVWGEPPAGLHLDRPIGRHRVHRQKMSGRGRGRTALTTVTAVEPLGRVSLVHVTIGTGRTHQIRVHLSEAGFPIAGDDLYGGARRAIGREDGALARIDRPMLHSLRLTFTHPCTHERLTFEAPLDETLSAVVAALREKHHYSDPLGAGPRP